MGGVILLSFIGTVDYVDRFLHRATASAIFLFFSAVIGAAGPFLTGLISHSLTAELGKLALGRALLIVPVAQVVAIACCLLASRRYLDQVLDA